MGQRRAAGLGLARAVTSGSERDGAGISVERVCCCLEAVLALAVAIDSASLRLHPGPRWHGGSATRNLNKTEVRLWTSCRGESGKNPVFLDARLGR